MKNENRKRIEKGAVLPTYPEPAPKPKPKPAKPRKEKYGK